MRTDSLLTSVPQIDARLPLRRLKITITLVLIWLLGLGLLAALTANPVTLNRDQIAESVVVVTAEVEDANAGVVRVRKVWKNPAWNSEKLTLRNLAETGATNGQILLIPVTAEDGDSYVVTPSKLPGHSPLVYPLTAESEQQLQSLLKTGRLQQ